MKQKVQAGAVLLLNFKTNVPWGPPSLDLLLVVRALENPV